MAKKHNRDCSNCVYQKMNIELQPCCDCDDYWYDKWEPIRNVETDFTVEPVMLVDKLREAMEKFNASAKKVEESFAHFHQAAVNDKFAKELKDIYDSLVRTGFTEKQAFSLLNTMVKSSYGYGR